MIVQKEGKQNYFPLNDQISIPELTNYEQICQCCGFRYSKIPSLKNAKFLNHWEISLGYPIGVSFVIISSYCVFLFVHTQIIEWINWWMILIMTILMLLFIGSYYIGILEGPGYLPFYYPYKLRDIIDKNILLLQIYNLQVLFRLKNKLFSLKIRFKCIE